MIVLCLCALLLQAPGGASPVVQSEPGSALIRVSVLPVGEHAAPDLRESASDLAARFTEKKKELVVVPMADQHDVVITVTDRGVTVPKFAIGVVPTGRPGGPGTGPMRVMHVSVTLDAGETSVEISNKNSPTEAAGGWKSAADDVAKQVEKWIADHKSALLAARGRF